MIEGLKTETTNNMKKSINFLLDEYKTLRTGKASPTLLDRVRVEAYDQKLPINQVGTIQIPEPRLIVIEPWDKSIISNIEKAIQKAELNLNPVSDGKIIRINIPALTEEVRKDIVKVIKQKAEEARVSVRNHRRDANDTIKKLEKDSDISEDDSKKALDEIQKITDKFIEEVNEIAAAKEKEIMTV